MKIIPFVLLLSPFCKGFWYSEVSPMSTTGQNNITFSCTYHEFVRLDQINPRLIAQARQNNKTEWRDIAVVYRNGYEWLNTDPKITKYVMRSAKCLKDNWIFNSNIFYCKLSILFSFEQHGCQIDPNLYSVSRCQFSNQSKIIESNEQTLSTKGHPPMIIQPPTILSEKNGTPTKNTQNIFRVGDVTKLQCIAHIDSINAKPIQNIRWCKKKSGRFQEFEVQDSPRNIMSSSEDGCTHIQESIIFYHIMQSDTDLEIMCESGYNTYNSECGKGSANATIFLQTNITEKADVWKVYPIIIYEKDGKINPQYINTYGVGKTIQLLCMASVQKIKQGEKINWCVSKEDEKNWTRIVTQEKEIKAIIQNNDGTVVYSSIHYHLTSDDKFVRFLCEINNSSYTSCNSGLISSSILVEINTDKKPQQTMMEKVQINTFVVGILSVILLIVLLMVVVLSITTYRRGNVAMCGIKCIIKRNTSQFEESSDGTGRDKEGHSSKTGNFKNNKSHQDNSQSISEQPESRLNVFSERQSFYENEVLKSDILNERTVSTGTTETDLCDYDDLQFKDEQQQYEELKL